MKATEPVIQTERLMLRLPVRADFDRYADMHADAETARHIGGAMQRAAAWRKFLQMPGAWAMQGYAMFSVVEKSSGKWIGQVGPWQPEGWPGTEVGWAFHRDAWGNGYAREGAIATIDWAFANLGWTEVIHSISPENTPSQALAKRLGSRILRQATLPPPYETVTLDIWGQSRDEWLAHRKGFAA
ncbi:MAG TPA: GNAT family N-acetyltransferase [Rudaea sp.]|jgi:RimJ/RimL family protein N-acetyltransferase|nr:GNAT family N-acetyltransferase [Rudaea sp.]